MRLFTLRACRTAVLSLALLAGPALATFFEFIPPNDPTGNVFSTNVNDFWDSGRGVVFSVGSTVTINSVGLFHHLSGINLSFEIARVTSLTGLVTTGQTVLASGNAVVSNGALGFFDFGIAPLVLQAGNSYHIEFTFSGNGIENFYFNNNNVQFSQGGFNLIDGTQGGSTNNFVMPDIRVNVLAAAVPTPDALALLALGLAGLGWSRRKK